MSNIESITKEKEALEKAIAATEAEIGKKIEVIEKEVVETFNKFNIEFVSLQLLKDSVRLFPYNDRDVIDIDFYKGWNENDTLTIKFNPYATTVSAGDERHLFYYVLVGQVARAFQNEAFIEYVISVNDRIDAIYKESGINNLHSINWRLEDDLKKAEREQRDKEARTGFVEGAKYFIMKSFQIGRDRYSSGWLDGDESRRAYFIVEKIKNKTCALREHYYNANTNEMHPMFNTKNIKIDDFIYNIKDGYVKLAE